MKFLFNISRQFKGILFFFIAILGVYVFRGPIFTVLNFFAGNRWEFAYKLVVYLVLISVIFLLPLAVALMPDKTGTEPEA